MHPSTPRNIKHWIPKAQDHLKAGQFGCTGYHQTIKLESCLLAAVAWYKSAAYQPSHSSGIFVRQQCLNLAPGNVMGGVAGVPNSWCQSPKLIHLAARNSQNWNSRVRKRKFQVFVLESSFLNVLCWGFSRIVQRFQTGWGKHPKDTVLHFLPSTRITFRQMCDRKTMCYIKSLPHSIKKPSMKSMPHRSTRPLVMQLLVAYHHGLIECQFSNIYIQNLSSIFS